MTDHPQTQEQWELDRIRLITAGQPELFYSLIQPYERAVFSTAFAMLGNPADAEDVAQEAFLKAFKHLSTFRAQSRFSTWLIQIALNEARLTLRRRRAHQLESLDAPVPTESGEIIARDFADWRDIPSEALDRKQLRHALTRAVASLDDLYREVLILRDLHHLSTRETAGLLGISTDVVKKRLSRARLQLRERLAPGYDGSWTSGDGAWTRVRLW